MTGKTFLLIVVMVAVGFMLYQNRAVFTPLADRLQQLISQTQQAWNNIPDPYKGYANMAVVGGVPTALMTFFAWTKTRAMQKLQQTQQQAQKQIASLHAQMQGVAAERDEVIADLQRQLEEARQSNPELLSALNEAQSLVSQKQTEIERLKLQYEAQVRALQNEIERLKLKVYKVEVIK